MNGERDKQAKEGGEAVFPAWRGVENVMEGGE